MSLFRFIIVYLFFCLSLHYPILKFFILTFLVYHFFCLSLHFVILKLALLTFLIVIIVLLNFDNSIEIFKLNILLIDYQDYQSF